MTREPTPHIDARLDLAVHVVLPSPPAPPPSTQSVVEVSAPVGPAVTPRGLEDVVRAVASGRVPPHSVIVSRSDGFAIPRSVFGVSPRAV